MKLFTNNMIEGLYPVGACAIAVAESLEEAITKMEGALAVAGISQNVEAEHMVEVDLTTAGAFVLLDGDY